MSGFVTLVAPGSRSRCFVAPGSGSRCFVAPGSGSRCFVAPGSRSSWGSRLNWMPECSHLPIRRSRSSRGLRFVTLFSDAITKDDLKLM